MPKNTCSKSDEKMVGGRPGPGLKIGAGAQGPGPGRVLALGPGQGPVLWPGPWVLALGPGPLRQFLSLGLVSRPPFFHNFLGMCFWGSKKCPRPFFHHFWGIGFGNAKNQFFSIFWVSILGWPKTIFSELWTWMGSRGHALCKF